MLPHFNVYQPYSPDFCLFLITRVLLASFMGRDMLDQVASALPITPREGGNNPCPATRGWKSRPPVFIAGAARTSPDRSPGICCRLLWLQERETERVYTWQEASKPPSCLGGTTRTGAQPYARTRAGATSVLRLWCIFGRSCSSACGRQQAMPPPRSAHLATPHSSPAPVTSSACLQQVMRICVSSERRRGR